MAYSLVTATDFADMLSELEIFLEAQGWTVDWNTGSQFGCHSGNCYAAFGIDSQTNPAIETDAYPSPDVNVQDFRAYGSLAKNWSMATGRYWNQSGSPVTSQVHSQSVYLNDLTGPFSEVHLFGDSTYVWVMIRSDADRWTHFGFGNLDKKGMTHPDCAFFVGMFWRWWDDANFNGFPIKANFGYNNGDYCNKAWMRSQSPGNNHIYVPDGVLDPSYLVDDFIRWNGMTNFPQIPSNAVETYSNFNDAKLLDHYTFAYQKPLTGGLPLLSVPVIVGDGINANTLLTFLGDLPGVRLCEVSNVPIGEEITYGSESYLAFPLKRRTTIGSSYDGKCSTYGLGIAFKKD